MIKTKFPLDNIHEENESNSPAGGMAAASSQAGTPTPPTPASAAAAVVHTPATTAAVAVAAVDAATAAAAAVPNPLIQDLVFQQNLLQMKHQQTLQRQFQEQHFQKYRELLQVEQERQLKVLLQQAQLQKVKEESDQEREHQDKLRLEVLKQKCRQEQSAVASPEVKRHLQEFVLSKKRSKEAAACAPGAGSGAGGGGGSSAASMSNLKLLATNNVTGAPSPASSTPILRKTASESNLLKIKNKRGSALATAPYSRANLPPSIPETSAVVSSSSQASSINSSPPVELNSPILNPQELVLRAAAVAAVSAGASAHASAHASSNASSTSSSPKTPPQQTVVASFMQQQQQQSGPGPGPGQPAAASSAKPLGAAVALLQQQQQHDQLASNSLNSKSLPNIPTAVSRLSGLDGGPLHKRKSPPPTSVSSRPPPPHHGAMIVRRSKSSAILPLRKHLMEKTLHQQQQQDKKVHMDEEQFYFHQKQIASSARDSLLTIKPIIEVMEEDQKQHSGAASSVEAALASLTQHQNSQARAAAGSPGSAASAASAASATPAGLAGLAGEGRDSMEVDPPSGLLHHQPSSFTARLGPSGLSPLVVSELQGAGAGISSDFVSRLLPRQPLDLAVNSKGSASAAAESLYLTGLGYDPLMLRHHCSCEKSLNHPEHPGRLLAIWNRLVEAGLVEQCSRVARRATLEEIQSCHSETHTLVYGTDMVNRVSLTGSQELNRDTRMGNFCSLECGGVGVDSDTYWNELETPGAVRTAVGTMLELSEKVALGELRNGFAIVRPPGHHAEYEEAMGFCYFNSVAIAAKQMLAHPSAGVQRVLVLDWGVHHGNGTQKAFYDNPNVLYISLHRHDNGNFYPGTGAAIECGTGAGLGYNINIAWTGGLEPPMADAEYLAAFRSVIMPVARAYDPDLVLVSSGFDAAVGHPHPIGGYLVSTACFAFMTRQLRQLARGKLVLALESGFNLEVLAQASEQCVRALLGLPIEKIEERELARRPCASAMETLQKTLAIHSPYWEVLRRHPESALLSHLEAWEKGRSEETAEAMHAMASLSMQAKTTTTTAPPTTTH